MSIAKARMVLSVKNSEGLTERKSPLEKAKAKPGSMRLAINAKCFDCVGCGHDTGWRDRVRDCFDTGCPLYNFRPFKRNDK